MNQVNENMDILDHKFITQDGSDFNKIEMEIYLWIEKYRPQKLEDIIGNEITINSIRNWFQDFKNKKLNTKRALLFSGPPGLGKTTMAHAILREYGYQIKEYNASDVRSKKLVHANLYKLINIGYVDKLIQDDYKPFGIIMDEVDGMSCGDKGGMAELIQFINPNRGKRSVKKEDKSSVNNRWLPPIICICNNNYDKKIIDLKKDCFEISFQKPKLADLIKIINKICQLEKFQITSSSKKLIAEYAQGDYRRLIIFLQNLYMLLPNKQQVIDDNFILKHYQVFCKKELDLTLFETINKLLNQKLTCEEILKIYETDKSLLPMMIHENYINFIIDLQKKSSAFVKLEAIQSSIDSIIEGDIIDKTMYNNQSWYLQPIHGLS